MQEAQCTAEIAGRGACVPQARADKSEFEAAFRRWVAKMERKTLEKKLHADWIPQMNVERGESYYFNVRR